MRFYVYATRDVAPEWWFTVDLLWNNDPSGWVQTVTEAAKSGALVGGGAFPADSAEQLRQWARSLPGWPSSAPFPLTFEREVRAPGRPSSGKDRWSMHLRVSADVRAAIEAAAAADGMQPGEWVTKLAEEEALRRQAARKP